MVLIALVAFPSIFFPRIPIQVSPTKEVLIEMSEAQESGQGLGTGPYPQTAKEGPFLKKVTEKPVAFWSNVKMPKPSNLSEEEWAKMQKESEKEREKEKDKSLSDEKYQLKDQVGQYVGWFGIVRESTWDIKGKQTTLLLEHKYFDDMVDLHQQIVSLYGAGDFTATVRKEKTGIPPLALVRIYGKVALDKDKQPTVSAEYVRVWEWGLFAFMDYGKDKTNPKWLKVRTLPGDSTVYTSRPTTAYYEQRLGKREPTGGSK